MRTVTEDIKINGSTVHKLFNLFIAEKGTSFTMQLKNVIRDCEILLPEFYFKTTVLNNPEKFNLTDLKMMDLVFIEDAFLLELSKPINTNSNITQDIILLLDGHFVGEEAVKIKQVITENSLNLTGHISLTNYPFNLVKLLVIDFIKSKQQ